MTEKDNDTEEIGNNTIHNVSKRCDCFIGIFHNDNEELHKNTVYERLSEHSRTTEMLFEHRLIKSPITIKQYLDKRSGFMTFFNYCPYCGEKIKWKQIKSECGI